MRRTWLRPFWILLALIFLAEAWLWDHLEPLVARVVSVIPWKKLKARLATSIEGLSPWATLIVFAVPFVLLLPVKFLEVYLIATQQWLAAGIVLVLAKMIGLGITAFIFDVTRDKLLMMAWFRRVYEWFLWARVKAGEITEPVRERMRQIVWLLKPQRASRFLRRFMRLRRNAYRGRAA